MLDKVGKFCECAVTGVLENLQAIQNLNMDCMEKKLSFSLIEKDFLAVERIAWKSLQRLFFKSMQLFGDSRTALVTKFDQMLDQNNH